MKRIAPTVDPALQSIPADASARPLIRAVSRYWWVGAGAPARHNAGDVRVPPGKALDPSSYPPGDPARSPGRGQARAPKKHAAEFLTPEECLRKV